jgi:hypothetical protein
LALQPSKQEGVAEWSDDGILKLRNQERDSRDEPDTGVPIERGPGAESMAEWTCSAAGSMMMSAMAVAI